MKLLLCSSLPALVLYSSLTLAQGAPAAPANNILQPLAQLNQTARQTVMDLGRVRVDKWKTDKSVKEQAQGNVESLQKNLTAALPALIQQVQANPASVGAAVKLYRNLNVVYDVLTNVAESTGAFGSKEDYQALANDVGNLDTIRRQVADDLELMASSQDATYARLQNQARAQQAAAAAAANPPKKVVIDDTQPASKTAKKKSSSKKKKTDAAATASNPPQ